MMAVFFQNYRHQLTQAEIGLGQMQLHSEQTETQSTEGSTIKPQDNYQQAQDPQETLPEMKGDSESGQSSVPTITSAIEVGKSVSLQLRNKFWQPEEIEIAMQMLKNNPFDFKSVAN
jgi:hypothetical protein